MSDKQVFVVMGNDYPDAVYDTEEAAEKYCDARKAADFAKWKHENPGKPSAMFTRRVYWRTYGFRLNDGAVPQ